MSERLVKDEHLDRAREWLTTYTTGAFTAITVNALAKILSELESYQSQTGIPASNGTPTVELPVRYVNELYLKLDGTRRVIQAAGKLIESLPDRDLNPLEGELWESLMELQNATLIAQLGED